MALSNIFREPRREITESAVGFGAVAGIIAADWLLAELLALVVPDRNFAECLVAATAFLIALCLLMPVIHMIGEGVCNALAKRGVELRPPRMAREPRSGDRCVWVRESENSVTLRPL